MKNIELSTLTAGQVTAHEYLTENGDLLLAKGVLLTNRHIDLLMRRNIFTLYVRENDEEQEIQAILTTDFNKMLSDLPLDEPAVKPTPSIPDASLKVAPYAPKALSQPEFKNIKSGEEGLNQLIASRKTVDLDNRLQEGHCVDRPVGIPLKEKIRQIATCERTDEYRKMVMSVYLQAIGKTKVILDQLADGKRIDYLAPRGVVEQIMRIFMTDMSYLINIVSMQQKSEEHIYNHSLNVAVYSLCTATAFGFNQHQALEIGIGALLHDSGMLLVPQEIYLKKGKLEKDEWYEIMKHPILGLHLLEKVDRLPEWVPYMAYQCHERENGKGYPKQRSSRLIHNYAKICGIADMYEAFSSPRPYRDAYIPYKALELVIKASKQGLLSGELVRSFVQFMSLFPIGSIVELSNRCIGKVIRTNPTSPSKPVVSVLFDSDGNELSGSKISEEDLSVNLSVSVVKAHPNNFRGITWTQGF
ncbi:MAG: HD domain-containing protein [Chitinispirillaceae bacterium]|nr:HD domain-containing protein [Chitinispirillaceae bacterium]